MAWKLYGSVGALALAGVIGAVAATREGRELAQSTIQVVRGPAATSRAPAAQAARTVPSAAVAVQATPHFRIRMVVPAYFYPESDGSDWDAMTAALARVDVVAIMNPASGPGRAGKPLNADYVKAVDAFRAAGGVVLGYVPSGYSGRRVNSGSSCKPAAGATTYTPADVADCAARYAGYKVDGIFVDEMGVLGNRPTSEADAFYTEVYDRLKMTNARWTVMGNPGTDAPESYLRKGRAGGADSLMTFENPAANYPSATPAPYTVNYQPRRFANVLHTAPRTIDFPGVLATAKARNVGYIYVTDDMLPNPYDRLPADWAKQVRQLATFNRTN